MQTLNELLHFDDADVEAYMPTLERVDEVDVHFARDISYREEVRARARSTIELMQHGMQVTETPETDRLATKIFNEQEPFTPHKEKPDVILQLEALLTKYDHEVVAESKQVRRYVMNKLLIESEEAGKASERLKALELLGKIAEVGMFIERSVVTIEHRTTKELESELEQTLKLLLNPETNTYEMPEPVKANIKDIEINI
tara:strand:- start:8072 stop:8671 length:600 start_codon:yes stop_codon:yes gene_type:complete